MEILGGSWKTIAIVSVLVLLFLQSMFHLRAYTGDFGYKVASLARDHRQASDDGVGN